MFFRAIFAICFAVLAIAVNGSPVPVNNSPANVNGSPSNTNGSGSKDDGSSNKVNDPSNKVDDSNKAANSKSQSSSQIKFCTDPSFGGACDTLPFNNNVCAGIPSDFVGKISSFGFDQGISCTLFDGAGCSGNSVPLAAPGSSQLADLGTSSYKCVLTN